MTRLNQPFVSVVRAGRHGCAAWELGDRLVLGGEARVRAGRRVASAVLPDGLLIVETDDDGEQCLIRYPVTHVDAVVPLTALATVPLVYYGVRDSGVLVYSDGGVSWLRLDSRWARLDSVWLGLGVLSKAR